MANRLKFDKQKKKAFLEMVSNGNTLSASAEACGVTLQTVQNHRHRNKNFNKKVKVAMSIRITMGEDSLYNQMLEGNTTATIFFLVNRTRHLPEDERYEHVQRIIHAGKVDTNKEDEITKKVLNDPTAAKLACDLLERIHSTRSGETDTSGAGNISQ